MHSSSIKPTARAVGDGDPAAQEIDEIKKVIKTEYRLTKLSYSGFNPDAKAPVDSKWTSLHFREIRNKYSIKNGGRGTRTPDIHVANVALSHLSYTPEFRLLMFREKRGRSNKRKSVANLFVDKWHQSNIASSLNR
jgi:hypothetical protein